mgnify:CR=1 FL=1
MEARAKAAEQRKEAELDPRLTAIVERLFVRHVLAMRGGLADRAVRGRAGLEGAARFGVVCRRGLPVRKGSEMVGRHGKAECLGSGASVAKLS